MKWLPMKGADPFYEVSDTGLIRKTVIMTQRSNLWGYKRVTVTVNGQSKLMSVHRLVAQTFHPNPENKRDVNHKNGIKDDNRIENLEWMTRSENIQHAFDTGLHGKGENHVNAKLSDEAMASILKDLSSEKSTMSELAIKHGVTTTLISNIWRGSRDASKARKGGLSFCSKAGRKKIAAPTIYPAATIIAIQAYLAEGHSRSETEQYFNVSNNLVQRIAVGKRTVVTRKINTTPPIASQPVP